MWAIRLQKCTTCCLGLNLLKTAVFQGKNIKYSGVKAWQSIIFIVTNTYYRYFVLDKFSTKKIMSVTLTHVQFSSDTNLYMVVNFTPSNSSKFNEICTEY
jgi:hypothetical protein